MTSRSQKEAAARKALEFIDDGMVVGLGTGSTAGFFITALAELADDGLDVTCVPTSESTRQLAEESGLKLLDLDHVKYVHITVDGADEIDAQLNLIKGGGGALLREKLVAVNSDRLIIIADERKLVAHLGNFPLPVEVIPFGFSMTARCLYDVLRAAGCSGSDVRLREDGNGKPFLTDSGNYILDCDAGQIPDPEGLAVALDHVTGVVEHGLFIGLADAAVIGGPSQTDIIERR